MTTLVGNLHNIERFATCAIRRGLKKIPGLRPGGFRDKRDVNIGLPRSVNAPFRFPGLTAGVSETGEILTSVVSEVSPALQARGFPRQRRHQDTQSLCIIVCWLRLGLVSHRLGLLPLSLPLSLCLSPPPSFTLSLGVRVGLGFLGLG